MKIIFLLHFYQPHDQQDDILDRIVNESYRPLVEGLLERPHAKIVVNVSGVLTDLLVKKGYGDVVSGFKTLAERGQIEFTGSGKYHAFLPLIPAEEVTRQIELNNRANKRAYGNAYEPVGFFSPEMAISDSLLEVVSENGFVWVAAPEVAKTDGIPTADQLYKDKKSGMSVFFRNKRVSSLVLSSVVRDAKSLVKETTDLQESDAYWFCVMDAETFGHHRIGHEKVLFDILDAKFFEPSLASEVLNQDLPETEIGLRDCTWTNEEQDFHLKGRVNSFVLWRDLHNPIHKLQWAFTDFVIALVKKHPRKDSSKYKSARRKLDVAIASDQFWWASVKPWWSLEMVESGAHNLREVVDTLKPGSKESKKAHKYYQDIMAKAFEWQRSGYIRKKHLENSGTYLAEPFKERTPSEWFNQLVLEFEGEMKRAAKKRDFEKAIKWRDALIKLQQGTDMYDVLHVVDELWSARHIPEIKPFLEHNWEEFSEFARGHFLDAGSKKEFEAWKKKKKSEAK